MSQEIQTFKIPQGSFLGRECKHQSKRTMDDKDSEKSVTLPGMACSDSQSSAEQALQEEDRVVERSVVHAPLTVDAETSTDELLQGNVGNQAMAGACAEAVPPELLLYEYHFALSGLVCGSCVQTVKEAVECAVKKDKLEHVDVVLVPEPTLRFYCIHDSLADDVLQAIENVGFKAVLVSIEPQECNGDSANGKISSFNKGSL